MDIQNKTPDLAATGSGAQHSQPAGASDNSESNTTALPSGSEGVDRFTYLAPDGAPIACETTAGLVWATPEGGWSPGPPAKLARLPLYNAPLMEAVPDERIIVHPNNQSVAAARAAELAGMHTGLLAGLRFVDFADFSPLHGRRVVVLATGPKGDGFADEVVKRLADTRSREVRVIRAHGIAELGGLSAWLGAGGNALKWPRLIDRAEVVAGGCERGSIIYRRMADVEATCVFWLWTGRIALGKVTIIGGHPGLGKSQLTIYIAANVTRGGAWPVDGTRCDAGSVIILNAEDDPSDTMRPRLEAAGADLDRVFVVDAVRELAKNGSQRERSFSLTADVARLDALLHSLKDPRLIVIDPISAYLGGVDTHRNSDVRAALVPLAELAARHRVAVVTVTHLNKGGSEVMNRFTGSGAFVAAARAAFVVSRDPDDPERRLFLPVKNNLGNDRDGLAFRVDGVTLPSGIGTSRIQWDRDVVTISATDALAPPQEAGERSATDEAVEWLQEELARGPRKTSDIKRDARGMDISDKALRRARERLGIKPRKRHFTGGWEWALPQDAPEHAQAAQAQDTGTLASFGASSAVGEAF